MNSRLHPRQGHRVSIPRLSPSSQRTSACSVPLRYPFLRSPFATRLPGLSFQSLPTIKFCNPFLLTMIRIAGGGYRVTLPSPLPRFLCFHALTHCPICKSFLLIMLQQWVGGVPISQSHLQNRKMTIHDHTSPPRIGDSAHQKLEALATLCLLPGLLPHIKTKPRCVHGGLTGGPLVLKVKGNR